MNQFMTLQIPLTMLLAFGNPLLAIGNPKSTDKSQPNSRSTMVLQKDAPLEVLIEALQSDDFSTSIRAVDFIGYRGEAAKEAVPALVKTLDVRHLRESSLHALKNIGPSASAAVPALFKSLTAYPRQPATRWIAANALANVGEAAIPTLKKGTNRENVYERLWCHASLAKLEGPNSSHLQILAKSMESTEKTTSLVAVRGLTMIGSDAKSVIPEIIAAMKNPASPKTDLAVLLAQMGKDATPAIPQLVILLDNPKAMTRHRAAYALSVIGGAELQPAVVPLIRMLAAEESHVREMAAKALGVTGEAAEQSIPHLVKRLKDENEHVRAAAATALGKISPSDTAVQDALIDAMKDESGRVRSSVAPVLAENLPVTKKSIRVFIDASDDNWRGVIDACETFFRRLGREDRELIPMRFKEQLRRG